MTDLPPDHAVVDHIVFTPAERALIREKIESIKVELDLVYDCATNADSPGIVRRFVDAESAFTSLQRIVDEKSADLVVKMLKGELHPEASDEC